MTKDSKCKFNNIAP